jgi:allophanate hydrolase
VIQSIFSSSSGFDATRAYEDIFTLKAFKNKVDRQFRDHIDVLVVPSTATHWTVDEIDEDPLGRNKINGSFTHFVNLVE